LGKLIVKKEKKDSGRRERYPLVTFNIFGTQGRLKEKVFSIDIVRKRVDSIRWRGL